MIDGWIQQSKAKMHMKAKRETVLWAINGKFMNDPLMGFDHC